MEKVIRITGRIVCAAAAAVIVLALILFMTGSRPAVVLSGSMEPTIKTGSLVIIDTDYDEPEENDVAAFETGGALVIHRLVERTDEGWVTKGDANDSEDPWRITDENIKGKTVFWVPELGYLIGRGGE